MKASQALVVGSIPIIRSIIIKKTLPQKRRSFVFMEIEMLALNIGMNTKHKHLAFDYYGAEAHCSAGEAAI